LAAGNRCATVSAMQQARWGRHANIHGGLSRVEDAIAAVAALMPQWIQSWSLAGATRKELSQEGRSRPAQPCCTALRQGAPLNWSHTLPRNKRARRSARACGRPGQELHNSRRAAGMAKRRPRRQRASSLEQPKPLRNNRAAIFGGDRND